MKYAKNTIGYWLSKLPKGDREKALGYAKKDGTLDAKENSPKGALYGAFIWTETEEGHAYWSSICKSLKKGVRP